MQLNLFSLLAGQSIHLAASKKLNESWSQLGPDSQSGNQQVHKLWALPKKSRNEKILLRCRHSLSDRFLDNNQSKDRPTSKSFFWGLAYVALSDPGVIWGQKYHLCLFAWKLIFGDWNHQRYIPWWQKMQKSAGEWNKKTCLHFLPLWPKRFWSDFTPYVCYLEGILTIWVTPYVVKSLN